MYLKYFFKAAVESAMTGLASVFISVLKGRLAVNLVTRLIKLEAHLEGRAMQYNEGTKGVKDKDLSSFFINASYVHL